METEAPTSHIQPQGGPMTMVSTNRPPLRRAVYVHVSDLTSPYNIDHARLEEELERVRAEKEEPVEASSVARLGVPTELDTSIPQRRLQPPRGGYNLCVLVGNVELVVDKNRVDGSRVRLAEVEVGDETGTVSLRARDDQIDVLMEVSGRSGAVVLRNCTLELYQGRHIRLAVTKWGKMSRYPDSVPSTPPPPSKINHDRNFSLIDLSLVASEMAELPQSDSQHGSESEGTQPQQQQQQQQQQQPQQQSQQQTQTTGRPRSYSQQSQNQQRRGNRRSSRTKPQSSPPVPQQQQQQPRSHYESTGMGYPGGLHGYGTGFEGSMSQQQYQYNVRRQEQLPPAQQHQQMMMHHQYEMQHRHMHQLYQPQREGNPPPPPSSPMLVPGAPSGSFEVPSQGSFDSSPYGPTGDVQQMPMIGSNPFLNQPQSQRQPPPPSPQQQRHHPTYLQSVTGARPSREGDPPASPRMNPQAATFDPSTGGPAG